MKSETHDRLPIDYKEFREITKLARTIGYTALMSPTISNAPVEAVLETRNKFSEEMELIFDQLWDQNNILCREEATDLLDTMYSKVTEKMKMNGYKNIISLGNDF